MKVREYLRVSCKYDWTWEGRKNLHGSCTMTAGTAWSQGFSFCPSMFALYLQYLLGGRKGMAPAGIRLLDVKAARSAVLDARAAASMSPGVWAVIPSRSSLSGRLGWSAT